MLDSTSARFDYSLSKRMTLFGRYGHSPSSLALDNSANRTTFNDGNDVYTAGWTWSMANSMNNDLRFNFTHTTLVKGVNPLAFTGSLNSIYPAGYAQPPSSFLSHPETMAIQIGGLCRCAIIPSRPHQESAAVRYVARNVAATWAGRMHSTSGRAPDRQAPGAGLPLDRGDAPFLPVTGAAPAGR